ncbi:butyrophilin subfamily 1 member A1-like isoform X3 [Lepisosteus oculatus]|uniref:butyrophilin subfamily 1 member A1-like isoform X3 n=1 Tax=Lepisosteus oculatus TaxID=7918 RepID=UPI0035F5055B
MKWHHWECLLTFHLFFHKTLVARSEMFQVLGPADPVVVFPGEDAVLPCYLSPDISTGDLEIKWFREDYRTAVCLYQYGSYNFEKQNPSYSGRAELFPEELPRGNMSLKLKDVRRSDHGKYKCVVESAEHYEDALIDLSIRALGSQPSVSLHSSGGDEDQLLCRSEGWFPEPAVIWTDRDGNDVTSLSNTTVERDSLGLLNVRSYISAKRESNIFSCLLRSALPETDCGSQLYISNVFPGPSRWMVCLFLTAAFTMAASALLVIHWRRMDKEERLWESKRNTLVLLKELGAEGSIPHQAEYFSLDPHTAHIALIVSEDGKRVRRGEEKDLPDNPQRFDYWSCVLSREGFTSGRHYWEVEGNDDWTIGVTRESAERKAGFSFVPQGGYWGLYSGYSGFSALSDPVTPLLSSLRPRKVGVCMDIEERKVSFYTVESRSHIYTFTDMVFNQGEKIYPVFRTRDRCQDLVLLPPVRCGD